MTLTTQGVVDVPAARTPESPVTEPTSGAGLSEVVPAAAARRGSGANPMTPVMRLACAVATDERPLGELWALWDRDQDEFRGSFRQSIQRTLRLYDDPQLVLWWQYVRPPQHWVSQWRFVRLYLPRLFPAMPDAATLPDYSDANFVALHHDCHSFRDGPVWACQCLL